MNKWIVVTTINNPTQAIKKISELCISNEWSAVVVGDYKTPEGWSAPNIHYLSPSQQKNLFPSIADVIPYNHYCRKNVGYLYAISRGAECILETDDDNIPYERFGKNLSLPVNGRLITSAHWVNVYRNFTDDLIWPRGLPLDHIYEYGKVSGDVSEDCPIQQYLADKDPDVDAIYRLLFKQPVYFDQDALPVILGENVWSPFNSQNTVFFRDAFPLLYLPCHVSFRMTDIWRSFVAQVGLWHMGKRLAFLPSTVIQERNEHDLNNDFRDEVSGYLENSRIATILEKTLQLSKEREWGLLELTRRCWEALIEENIISDRESEPMSEWLRLIQMYAPE